MPTIVQGADPPGNARSTVPPVPNGAVYRLTPATRTDGQASELRTTSRDALVVAIQGDNSVTAADTVTPADGQTNAAGGLITVSRAESFNGATWDRLRTPNVFKPFAGTIVSAGTGGTFWTPAGGKKFRLMGWEISSDTAAALIFGDNAVGTIIDRTAKLAAAGISSPPGKGNGKLSAVADNVLKIDTTATCTIAGCVWGTEE